MYFSRRAFSLLLSEISKIYVEDSMILKTTVKINLTAFDELEKPVKCKSLNSDQFLSVLFSKIHGPCC